MTQTLKDTETGNARKIGTAKPGAPQRRPRSARILGVRVDDVTNGETLELIGDFVNSGGKHQVATVNPEFIMEANRNPEFFRTLNSTSLSFPDGIGIVYASRLYGAPFRERVAGIDIVQELARISVTRGFTMFFLGAGPGIADRAADILKKNSPGARIVGTWGGSPSPKEEKEICARINAVKPDILLVAYGAPKQDLWISRNLHRLEVSVAMGVGGTFDFITGESRRAPGWVRRSGFEWLHRLGSEPWRWRRMLALPRFAVRCVFDSLSNPASR